jgi:hypothetical protein
MPVDLHASHPGTAAKKNNLEGRDFQSCQCRLNKKPASAAELNRETDPPHLTPRNLLRHVDNLAAQTPIRCRKHGSPLTEDSLQLPAARAIPTARFVLMPDHFHLLITPAYEVTLERAMQLIKGGFSHAAGKNEGTESQHGSADSPIIAFVRPRTSRITATTFTRIQLKADWWRGLVTTDIVRPFRDSS